MPRMARYNVPGVVYHLITRFVDRAWFLTDDEERATYLRFLANALVTSDWRCIAYALMSNHIHLAFIAGVDRMATWLKRVHSPFAHWMNKRHGRLGPVLAHRPKDYAVLPQDEAKLIAYIHNNPVRAGVVTRASESTWTSHRAYAGLVEAPSWLHVDDGLRRMGLESGEVDAWIDLTPGSAERPDVRRIHREARRRGALEVATPLFDGQRTTVPLVARPFAHVRVDPRHLIQEIAELTALPETAICSRRRSPELLMARTVASHSGRLLGLTSSDIAAALGVSDQAVSNYRQRALTAFAKEVIERVLERMGAGSKQPKLG